MVKAYVKPTRKEKTNGASETGRFQFTAMDVTSSRGLEVHDIQRSTPAGSAAKAIAARMELPGNVAWALRNDSTGAYLDEDRPIGDQLEETGSKLTVTPKSHLGGAMG